MLFNSSVFLQFFAAFLLLYWLVRDHLRARNVLIVVASYFFYGWWSWQFLLLLCFSSSFDFLVGLGLARLKPPRQRRWLLLGSVVVNLGILGFFKYYQFFVDSMAALLERLEIPFHTGTLQIVLPVGISFYTFQSMSYALDVYRGHLQPTRNFVNFLAYVSFFPQLVAGPIERAGHLLPQFERTVVITRAMVQEGIWLMIWGMFKKVVVADNLAPLADLAFGQTHHTAAGVVLGVLCFALQIYCDFSGYSDIARGSARVLGFDIMWNFDLPYAASNLRNFWRRWHISLSTWLRDYLYVSLGGNRRGAVRTYVNLILTMLLGGLWHGAAWNFVGWGLWHGIGLAMQRAWESLTQPSRPGTRTAGKLLPSPNRLSRPRWARVLGWACTMLFVGYGWLLFRARSGSQLVSMTAGLADLSLPVWAGSMALNLVVFALPLIAIETWQVVSRDRLAPVVIPWRARALLQGVLIAAIMVFWHRKQTVFIYFQF